MNPKIVYGGILIAIVIAVGGYFFPHMSTVAKSFGSVGGVTAYNSLGVSQLKIGSNCNDEFKYGSCAGTALNQFLDTNTCQIIGNKNVSASSTAAFDCAITGVVSGDVIVTEPATTTAGAYAWEVVGASASSTSGFVTLNVYNPTSVAANVPSYIASSTSIIDVR